MKFNSTAAIVNFIYRPEYYNIDMWDTEPQTSCLGQAEFIIAKHRNGPLGSRRLKFIASLAEMDIASVKYLTPCARASSLSSCLTAPFSRHMRDI